jgi:hypothetical protein
MTLEQIGHVVRLQVQRGSLKAGAGRLQYYDPMPILAVDAFEVTVEGVTWDGPDGEHLDVHHARHRSTKNRSLANSLSFGFTSHYDRMRERFGPHLTDGIAGENILIRTDKTFGLRDVDGGLIIEGVGGHAVPLESISVAHPCVEFSRFALRDPAAPPLLVSEALRFLDDGVRGYYAVVQTSVPVRVRVGDRVLLKRQSQ